ncbi:uncharacterized protein DSM5745_09045 [Aspergillus mulundensis]|uniref:Uncharacterized protein n=1 Tax=Aspergillus mulundensis TaxID=1810919 RepID=A0A3D8QZH1_9EURO|nr:hypothetical protein DSM5745_09045 [Aspergillus mulundensis]RDW67179.1 hypothetical protein DSM5745_09045 [Aspergillus mulundensis]
MPAAGQWGRPAVGAGVDDRPQGRDRGGEDDDVCLERPPDGEGGHGMAIMALASLPIVRVPGHCMDERQTQANSQETQPHQARKRRLLLPLHVHAPEHARGEYGEGEVYRATDGFPQCLKSAVQYGPDICNITRAYSPENTPYAAAPPAASSSQAPGDPICNDLDANDAPQEARAPPDGREKAQQQRGVGDAADARRQDREELA